MPMVLRNGIYVYEEDSQANSSGANQGIISQTNQTAQPLTPAKTNQSSGWYTGLGKVGDQEGMNYWDSQITAKGHDQAFKDFTNAVNAGVAQGKQVGLGDIPKPTTTPQTTPQGTAQTQQGSSASWYTGLGKVGDQKGINYWNGQIAAKGQEQAFKDFTTTVNNGVAQGQQVGLGNIGGGYQDQYAPNKNYVAKYGLQDVNGSVRYDNLVGKQNINPVPTQDAYALGIDPIALYQRAGLKVPVGTYGENGTFIPNIGQGRDDTIEQKKAREAVLVAAGMSPTMAAREADVGFWMSGGAKAGDGYTDRGVNPNSSQALNAPAAPVNPYSPPNSSGGGIIQNANSSANNSASTSGGTVGVGAGGAFNYNPAQLGTPTQWNVTAPQTVAGQVLANSNPNSALGQQAIAQGLTIANDRGLINSSIAQTAAQSELNKLSLNIANADAATHAKASGYNADMSNQFTTQNVNAQNTAGQFNAGAANNLQANNLQANTSLQTTAMNNAAAQANAQLAAKTQEFTAKLQAGTQLTLADKELYGKLQMADYDAKTRINLANIDAGTRTRLSETEANYKNVLQSNQSAANIYQQITQSIAAIGTSSLTEDAKKNAIYNLETKLKESLSVLGAISGMNLGDLVTVSTPPTASNATPNAQRYGSILEGHP